MKIGKYELNRIYNEDSYKAIQDIPDKSVDLVYIDIPYEMQSGGKGGARLVTESTTLYVRIWRT